MDSLQHQRQTEQCYIKEAFSLARCVVCVGVCGGGGGEGCVCGGEGVRGVCVCVCVRGECVCVGVRGGCVCECVCEA